MHTLLLLVQKPKDLHGGRISQARESWVQHQGRGSRAHCASCASSAQGLACLSAQGP